MGLSRPGFVKEIKRHWNIDIADIPLGDYGWGFVKLETLFLNNGERFFVLDADTVMTGKLLEERAKSTAPFFVDNELLSNEDSKRLYYDWDEVKTLDPSVQTANRAFNVGQWFGTGGLLKREEFDKLIDWTFPRKLKYPNVFMGGDQGIINCVLLKKEALEQLKIDRQTIMRWPAKGMDDITPQTIKDESAPALIVHWAGLKQVFLHRMPGSDLLMFFENYYYTRIPNGSIVRIKNIVYHIYMQWKHYISVRFHLSIRKYFGYISK